MFSMTLISLIIAALLSGATAPAEELGFYPMATIVIGFEEETDTVICSDFNGMEWRFEGIEDWCIGDCASMIMCDNGTTEISDDIICNVRYCGWINGNFLK